jgi:hypothetical protein
VCVCPHASFVLPPQCFDAVLSIRLCRRTRRGPLLWQGGVSVGTVSSVHTSWCAYTTGLCYYHIFRAASLRCFEAVQVMRSASPRRTRSVPGCSVASVCLVRACAASVKP